MRREVGEIVVWEDEEHGRWGKMMMCGRLEAD